MLTPLANRTTIADVPADLLDRVRTTLALTGAAPTPTNVAAALRADGTVCGDAMVLAVVTALRREALGAGPLDSLLAEPGVTDILVNGPGEVYIDRGHGLELVPIHTGDEPSIRRLATRLAAAAGRRLDDSTPYVDVRLSDGTRFHAVLAPIASPGTCLSLRVPARRIFTLEDLITAGALPEAGATILQDLLDSRVAFLISGGTGTGKTTLLNSLLSLTDPADRLVLVEDASELHPAHPHVVRLEARPPNVEGSGEISLRDLVRQALRMRPDRLVVGEVRGPEVVDLLIALNTGHEGGCGTIHANSAADVPARLEALGALAGLPQQAIHSQAASALHAVIHLTRTPTGHRRIAEIHTLTRSPHGPLTTHPAVTFHPNNTLTLHPPAHLFTTHPTTPPTRLTTTYPEPAPPDPTPDHGTTTGLAARPVQPNNPHPKTQPSTTAPTRPANPPRRPATPPTQPGTTNPGTSPRQPGPTRPTTPPSQPGVRPATPAAQLSTAYRLPNTPAPAPRTARPATLTASHLAPTASTRTR
ncbi:TadA family conjugal transfer-associated ATPase [Kribbella solani]|uniref:TadA family conjugal transfer-associated ATPase n=2 Tax=Kribbella solani TaxID=236067 RepID=UPI0029BFCC4F|nr:TadA family conjugal transfer-associated ATPase [Kribbella solani]